MMSGNLKSNAMSVARLIVAGQNVVLRTGVLISP